MATAVKKSASQKALKKMPTKKAAYTTGAFKTGDGWQFDIRAANGRVLALSVQSYPTKFSAERAAESIGSVTFIPRERESAE